MSEAKDHEEMGFSAKDIADWDIQTGRTTPDINTRDNSKKADASASAFLQCAN